MLYNIYSKTNGSLGGMSMKVKFAVEFEVELPDNSDAIEDVVHELTTTIATHIENCTNVKYTGEFSYLTENDCSSKEYLDGIFYYSVV